MKKLIFVRHAKAEEEIPGLSDFERSLTENGKKIAKKMALIFKKKEDSPGLMISSPAFRALETALIFAGENDVDFDRIVLDNRIYFNFNLESLKKILAGAGEDVNTVTFFGHNPAFTDLPGALAVNGCGPVPKTSVVCLSFDVPKWEGIKRKSGKLEYFLKPEK